MSNSIPKWFSLVSNLSNFSFSIALRLYKTSEILVLKILFKRIDKKSVPTALTNPPHEVLDIKS